MSAASVNGCAAAAFSYTRLAGVFPRLGSKYNADSENTPHTPPYVLAASTHNPLPLPASLAEGGGGGFQVTTHCVIRLLTANCVNSSAVNVDVWELSVNLISLLLFIVTPWCFLCLLKPFFRLMLVVQISILTAV